MANSKNTISQETEQEIWKPIPRYPGYDVSNLGRVRSWWFRGNRKYKRDVDTPIILKGDPSFQNRRRVQLKSIDGKRVRETVACLVLKVFIGARPDGMQCCHNDGDPSNDHVGNLRWDTAQGNAQDRNDHGTAPIMERNTSAKLTRHDIPAIREMFVNGMTYSEISIIFNVTTTTVYRVCTNANWKNLPGPTHESGKYAGKNRWPTLRKTHAI